MVNKVEVCGQLPLSSWGNETGLPKELYVTPNLKWGREKQCHPTPNSADVSGAFVVLAG